MTRPPRPRQAPRRGAGKPPKAHPDLAPATTSKQRRPVAAERNVGVEDLLRARSAQDPRFQQLADAWVTRRDLPWLDLPPLPRRRARWWRWLLPGFAVPLGLAFLADGRTPALGILLLVVAVLLPMLRRGPAIQRNHEAGTLAATWFFESLGLALREQPELSLDSFRLLNLVPEHVDSLLRDEVSGRIDGRGVRACRLRLMRRGYKKRVITFDGLLALIELPLAIDPPLFVTAYGGLLGSIGRALRRFPAAPAPADFDRIFAVAGAELGSAPAVPETVRILLLRLAAAAGAPFRAALTGRWLFLALDRPPSEWALPLAAFVESFNPEPALRRCLARYDQVAALARAVGPVADEG